MKRVSYKKLWKMLIDIDLNKTALAEMAGMSGSTLSKMVKGECVNVDILVRICNALECDIFDIMELVPVEEKEEKVLKSLERAKNKQNTVKVVSDNG